ncbi:TPA: B3/4 domain-containing protein [Salmonella enterica]
MSSMLPSISPELARIAPGFRALSINVIAAPVRDAQVGEIALKEACQAVINGQPAWAQAHIDAWNAVFKAFGAKPKRTPCSAEALRKRVLKDGTMAALDPVVDLYSAAYCGSPRLVFADGSETFDTLKEGQPVTESPEPGEVIWRDDRGVTCRRWNWRQGVRTRLSASDKTMWFILESLPEMPVDELYAAENMLTDGLEKMMPGLRFESTLIGV